MSTEVCNYVCYTTIKNNFKEEQLNKEQLKIYLKNLDTTVPNTNIFWKNGPTKENLDTLKNDIKNKYLQLCNLKPLKDVLKNLDVGLKETFNCKVYDIYETYIGDYMQGYVWNNYGKINTSETLYCKGEIKHKQEEITIATLGATPDVKSVNDALNRGGTIKFKKTKRRKNSRKKTKKKQKH